MKPGARLQAAIEALEAIEAAERPADQVIADYLRKRRYIGSKDRRAVSSLIYSALRHRARLGWWLGRVCQTEAAPRIRMLADVVLRAAETVETLDRFCGAEPYGPAALSDCERALLQTLEGRDLDSPEQPAGVRLETPAWLLPAFERAFGSDLEAELAALGTQASTDLRCNSLKADRASARAALASEGIETEPTPLSPLGLRLSGRRAVQASRAFRDGLIEVQDEGSQVAALLCDAAPGMAVADLCAGAGGKTLALAAAMAGQGRLLASDPDPRRLERARGRLQRAGAGFVECRVLAGAGPGSDLHQAFDRVLVDAPCSGSGAWRRQPDARWRLTAAKLSGYRASQRDVLWKAASLVRPGGRLIYVTCSLLREENQDQVEAFLAAQEHFAPHPIEDVWARHMNGPCPSAGGSVTLTPAANGTDGFFVAVFDRRADP